MGYFRGIMESYIRGIMGYFRGINKDQVLWIFFLTCLFVVFVRFVVSAFK